MTARRAVFFDWDGTLRAHDRGDDRYYTGAAAAVELAKARGFLAIGITNQPLAVDNDVERVLRVEMRAFGLDAAYVCPHRKAEGCVCHKPLPCMLEQAARDHDLDLAECFVVGDRASDVHAGEAAGCHCILVLTGRGKEALMEIDQSVGP